MNVNAELPAPGARVVIRDAQWLVRKVERTQGKGHVIHVIGLSDIVRNKEAQFLTSLEQKIEIIDPAKTLLTQDSSAAFRDSLLYLESLLQKTIPTDGRIYCGYKAAMDSVPYQLEPAQLALAQPRQRLLIADAVGLGKTLECGILLSELIRRGRGRRILVVTVKSMLTQFQKELWSRFTIPLTRLDSAGLRRVREHIPANQNPFYYYDKSIVSIDTLKQDGEYRVYLENAYWDIIVIDEAHNVAERGTSSSQRARLARLLASRSDSLIMLSATPHDGSARSFASLMNMLDPTAIANPNSYGPEDIRGLFIRRFKKDIKNQVSKEFQEREITVLKADASPAEELAYDALTSASFPRLDQHKGGGQLFRTVLEKALFSSPAACLETIAQRLKKLQNIPEAKEDICSLEHLRHALQPVSADNFSKFQRLVTALTDPQSPFFFTGKSDDRVIIFTERIATLDFLKENLAKALKLKAGQLCTLRGTDSDMDQQQIVEEFGKESSKVRLLIASDVASEGINLHYLSHKMIHFDVPWSLMIFQQRNGRIDRYGQTKKPHIGYLITGSANPDIHGDQRILELLIEKDKSAMENIGDPSAFLGLYDPTKEEDYIAKAMESSDADTLRKEMDARVDGHDEDDLLAFLDQMEEYQPAPTPRTASLPTLFASDFDFARRAMESLGLQYRLHEDEQAIEIPMKDSLPRIKELKYRFRQLPREIKNGETGEDWTLRLSARRDVIMKAMALAQREENSWPRVQYLWELHPFMQWLSDAVTAHFRRNEAPVLSIPGMPEGKAVYVVNGTIPNLKGHPMVADWFGCVMENGKLQPQTLTLEEIFGPLGLLNGKRHLANPVHPVNIRELSAHMPEVVELSRIRMRQKSDEMSAALAPQLKEQLDRLSALQKKRMEQLSLDTGISLEKRESKERNTANLFNEYKQWIRETLHVESEHPSIRIAAVLAGA